MSQTRFQPSEFTAAVAEMAVKDAGPWLVRSRSDAHLAALELVDVAKYRTEADKTLDLKFCNLIFDRFGRDTVIFSEERGIITLATRNSVDWDNPRREKVDIASYPRVAVLDSLDGTLNWSARGMSNNYSIAVTLLEFGKAVQVMIYFPHDRELYVAELGKGAWMKAEHDTDFTRLRTSGVEEVNRSVVIVDHGKVNKSRIYPIKERLAQDGTGAIAIPDLVCSSASWRAIARGGAHAFMGFTVAPEDYYPSLLVTEAGGVVTTLDPKGVWNWDGDRSVFAAANAALHRKIAEHCGL